MGIFEKVFGGLDKLAERDHGDVIPDQSGIDTDTEFDGVDLPTDDTPSGTTDINENYDHLNSRDLEQ